jgi:hypothetical protein
VFDDQDFGCNFDLENKREVEKIIEYLNKLDSGIDNLLEFVLKS